MKNIRIIAMAGALLSLASICFCCAAQGGPKADEAPSIASTGAGCLVDQEWIQHDLQQLGLRTHGRAFVRYGSGTIPGTSPETPGLVTTIFYSPDGKHGWMFFFRQGSDGKIRIVQNAYRLRKSRNLWSASEGNGGIATYDAMGAFAGELSKKAPSVVNLVPGAQSCSSEP